MKISLTGSSGFVGQNLLEKLLKDGHEVKILSSSYNRNNETNATVIEGTLSSEYRILESFLDSSDFIINCAGEIINENKMIETNINGIKNLLNVINHKKINIKWIQLASAGIYKRSHNIDRNYEYITENSKVQTDNLYEKTKSSADDILLDACNNMQIKAYVLRTTAVYGKDMPNDSLRRLIKHIKHRLFFYIGSKDNILSYLHVDDLTDLIAKIVISETSPSGIYNISNDSKISLTINEITKLLDKNKVNFILNKKLATYLVKIIPKIMKFPLNDSVIRALTSRSIIDSSKACKELGYKPKKPIYRYIHELINSL